TAGARRGSVAARRHGPAAQVGRIEVVLARDADQREQRVTPGVGQRRAHSMWARRVRNAADWPVRGDPLARLVREHGCEIYGPARAVDGCGLYRRDLVLAQRLADDIEAARERGVAEAAGSLSRPIRTDSRHH